MLQTVEAEKVAEKIRIICLVSMFPLSKKEHFYKFLLRSSVADLKIASVKAIYIYASESSHYTLWENGIVYRSPNHHSWDVSN